MVIAARDIQVHLGLRFLRWSKSYSSPIAPCTSVLAGSKFSNTYARVYLYDFLDELHLKFSSLVVFGVHVDDIATHLSATSTTSSAPCRRWRSS